ncbi:MAG: recombinase family protein, partial [Verrucomicrobiia bacterium]
MNAPPIPCALYPRVSSRNQLNTDYGSLQTQRERLEAWCKSQENHAVQKVYEDGAFSAETIDRPALKEMLKDIQDGKIKCVVAYKIDRLTRSVKDFHHLMEFFDKYGVTFVATTQALDTSTPTGRLMRNILLDFAQFEREMTADRTRDKCQQRAEKGLWSGGNPPYGYTNENKRLVKHPEEAPRLRFIFEHFAKEHSLTRIQEELSRRGCTYRSGRPWGKGMLNHILRNPIYAGKIRFNGKIYPGQHEALVSEAMLHKTQTAKRDGSHGPSKQPRFFILKGLLKCADCGSAMTPHYSQKRNRDGSVHRVPYYRCTKTIHFNSRACRLKHLNADKIEKKVVTDLYALTENVDFVQMSVEEVNRQNRAKVGPQQQELDTLTKRLTELDREIKRFMQAFGKGSMPLELLE